MDYAPVNELRPHPRNVIIYGDEDIEELAHQILRSGWMKPLVITEDNRIISGHRRWRAAALLGDAWALVPVERRTFPDETAELEALLVENHYRDKMPEQRVREAEVWREIEQRRAAERRRLTQNNDAARARASAVLNSAPQEKGKTRDKLAERVQMKRDTYVKAAAVVAKVDALKKQGKEQEGRKLLHILNTKSVNAAAKVATSDKAEEVLSKLVAGEAATVVQAQRLVIADEIDAEREPLPTGPFRVIVADPPWPYEKRSEDLTHRARLPYPDMTVEDIRALPVEGIAAPDAILWLWTTNAHLREAFTVLDAWGFAHKTVLSWVKDRMGTGDWLRGQTEHCLLAVRGRPVVNLTNQTTVLYGPLRQHSRKPDTFYALVEALCPGARVELFSRQPRVGWQSWGGETELFDGGAIEHVGTRMGGQAGGGRVA